MEKLNTIEDLRQLREKLAEELFQPDKARARVCCGTACTHQGLIRSLNAIEDEAARKGLRSIL